MEAGAAAGEKGIYITLSESPKELTEVAESHNWSLDGISLVEMAPHNSGSIAEDEYTVFHPSDVELGDTIKSVLDKVEELNPTRVAFDSLSELRMLARESLRYRRQILALKRYFEDKDTTVLLLDDRTECRLRGMMGVLLVVQPGDGRPQQGDQGGGE